MYDTRLPHRGERRERRHPLLPRHPQAIAHRARTRFDPDKRVERLHAGRDPLRPRGFLHANEFAGSGLTATPQRLHRRAGSHETSRR